jgi:hypothetical protein
MPHPTRRGFSRRGRAQAKVKVHCHYGPTAWSLDISPRGEIVVVLADVQQCLAVRRQPCVLEAGEGTL